MMPATAFNRVLRMLFWETTIRCNLACAHCRRLESNDTDAGDLSPVQAETLIEQLAQLGRRQPQMPVLVFSGGEPLCRQDLFDRIDNARQNGLITALATNGTMIDEEQARRIRDSGVARVSVSLDGATAEVHDRMRQIPGAFDRALAGARHLREHQVPFQINVTLTKQNVGQLQKVYDLTRSLGAAALHIFMLVPVGCGQVLAQTEMLSPQQYEQILRAIYALENRGEIQVKVTCGPHYERVKRQLGFAPGGSVKAEGLGDGSTAHSEGHRQAAHGAPKRDESRSGPLDDATRRHPQSKGCLAGLGVLFVSHRGDVYPCGYLPVNCGNILEKRLIEIWDQSEDLARLRDAGALEGKCGVCEYKQVCGGCRARAFGMTGNYLGEEPFCAYHPRAVKSPNDKVSG
jgi:radical SAM protein with 4Fe4S-binding SPASM domain